MIILGVAFNTQLKHMYTYIYTRIAGSKVLDNAIIYPDIFR